MSQRPTFQTDFARPSALPTASLGPRNQAKDEINVDSDVYLDKLQEEWNKKIDDQVQVLVDNMVDIVKIANIGTKDHFRAAQENFQTELKAESMVLAANSLLSLTHALKLMFLLSDEENIARGREEELQRIRKNIHETQKEAIRVWEELDARNSTQEADISTSS